MKCLTLKQPLADLVVDGKKTVELRKWNTTFRGEFLVHASKEIDLDVCRRLDIDPASLVTGAVVGSATVVGVKVYGSGREVDADAKLHMVAGCRQYSDARFGFILGSPRKFARPVPMDGWLRFFDVDKGLVKEAERSSAAALLRRGERGRVKSAARA